MPETKFDEAMPFAPLKIISIGNCNELGMKIDKLITARRKKALLDNSKPAFKMPGYNEDSYLVPFECPRFGTGEGKAVINKSIRGTDLYIIADTVNYSNTYTMRGSESHMSPDDYFMDIKRVKIGRASCRERVSA